LVRGGWSLVFQLGLGSLGGVVLAELLLVATPASVDMLGFIKHRVKIMPDSINTLGVSISLLKALSCCFLNTLKSPLGENSSRSFRMGDIGI
jgi:hypothetical protein